MSKYLKRLHFAPAKTQYIPLQTGLRFHSRGYEKPPHQGARGITNSKRLAGTPNPPFMEGDKADHVPPRRRRADPTPGGHPLRLRLAGEETQQTIGDEGL